MNLIVILLLLLMLAGGGWRFGPVYNPEWTHNSTAETLILVLVIVLVLKLFGVL